jgi:predicted enzyme related to lactoylglutathione lyase
MAARPAPGGSNRDQEAALADHEVEHGPDRIAQIHISVTDLDASVAFYRDVLGLTHLFTVPGQPMAFFDAGGVRLYLGVPEDETYRSQPVIYYNVADLDATYDAVVERGAKTLSAPQLVHTDGSNELWMAFVSDPDGNPVGMSTERAVSA